ncbi:MAG: hypothetical protein V3S26_00255 [Acidimicrobiia bacterium]
MARQVKNQGKPSVPKKANPGDKPAADDPDGHPSWRFESFDHYFPPSGGVAAVDQAVFQEIVETLRHCEQKPTSQMYQGWSKQKGAAVIYDARSLNELPRDTKRRLDSRQLGDLEELIRIRAGGVRRRIFAWRGHGNVFNIIWWDPEHEVWPTQPD